MGKVATKYIEVHPWKIIENDFHEDRSEVSESLFTLANEYVGVRGFFDEGYGGKKLIGTYFNGIYEVPKKLPENYYRGISNKVHFMVNSVNFLATSIFINGEKVDLNTCQFKDFKRELDLKSGELTREYIYVNQGSEVEIKFSRLLDMKEYHHAVQKIEITPLTRDVDVKVISYLDYDIKHFGHLSPWKVLQVEEKIKDLKVLARTKVTKQKLLTQVEFISNIETINTYHQDQKIGKTFESHLKEYQTFVLEKRITNITEKEQAFREKTFPITRPYEEVLFSNRTHFEKMWEECDIEITGDDENLQGIRFCIFQLMQTYQGLSPSSNIGAKGLSGEAYSGHAFWDTETYCLPFYLFSNPTSVKNLLMFRYHTLKEAKLRAKELDCEGACYPIATLNGTEGCNLWQHASLQFQPSTAVAYGIWHYVHVTKDLDFLYQYGAEMLVEISRFLSSRGDWNPDKTHFGFYGVMGPDEFQMMVHHNTYTNYMAKRTFLYTLEVLKDFKKQKEAEYQKFLTRLAITEEELSSIKEKSDKMQLLYDPKTLLYEQHAGYFDLPHVDIKKIPVTDFPLYNHWSYDRIYRNDMIKQPDVLMMMFLYNQSFSREEKLANYEFYEPRCIHESSLSPSVHSILACELGKYEEAFHFFQFATRMDLDDYNRNTREGLHMTSIAAAWMNIVYGFGGLRSDGEMLSLRPSIPKTWDSYKFSLVYLNRKITLQIKQDVINIQVLGDPIELKIYDKVYLIENDLTLDLMD